LNGFQSQENGGWILRGNQASRISNQIVRRRFSFDTQIGDINVKNTTRRKLNRPISSFFYVEI